MDSHVASTKYVFPWSSRRWIRPVLPTCCSSVLYLRLRPNTKIWCQRNLLHFVCLRRERLSGFGPFTTSPLTLCRLLHNLSRIGENTHTSNTLTRIYTATHGPRETNSIRRRARLHHGQTTLHTRTHTCVRTPPFPPNTHARTQTYRRTHADREKSMPVLQARCWCSRQTG